jgi:hypothetical protein
MCSRHDTEHLQPELEPAQTEEALAEQRATDWPAKRQAQLDERAAQVLAGALEDHRRAGL